MGLLKNIDPLLTADLLYVLRAMGHGDMLAVVDCNFPAVEVATKVCTKGCVCLCALCRLRLICDCVMQTTTGKLVVLAGSNAPDTLDAITSVLPIDAFVESPLKHMSPSPGISLPPAGAEVHAEAKAAVAKHSPSQFAPLERYEFYDTARKAFAVVQTSERRPYGCFLLQKGVVGESPTAPMIGLCPPGLFSSALSCPRSLCCGCPQAQTGRTSCPEPHPFSEAI